MDFLKTLLAYITLMATLGVQEGPAPQTVPTPTPLPPNITASPVPNQTASPTATLAPTDAPAPTITPNTRYGKIELGDSGNNVRKLQNRLIELGYLPEGAADAKYGYQTYNAVKAFQKANKLSVDGVAGPATLTHLYENPDVIGVVAPTEVPTATPTPSLPPLATPEAAEVTPAPAADTGDATTGPTAEPTTPVAVPTTPVAVPTIPATMTLLDGAHIIFGADGSELLVETLVDGQPALVRPELWLNTVGAPVMSLTELADGLDGWTLQGSSADGLYTLHACGYTVSIHLKAEGPSVLVDGAAVLVPAEDAFLRAGTLYVTDNFLRLTLNAQTVFDADEKSLVLFFKDKSVAEAQD